MKIQVFWYKCYVYWYIVTDVSEENATSIFNAKELQEWWRLSENSEFPICKIISLIIHKGGLLNDHCDVDCYKWHYGQLVKLKKSFSLFSGVIWSILRSCSRFSYMRNAVYITICQCACNDCISSGVIILLLEVYASFYIQFIYSSIKVVRHHGDLHRITRHT